MNLEQKLRQLKEAAKPRNRDTQLAQTLEYLRKLGHAEKKKLPGQRVAKGIEDYVDGKVHANASGEFFLAEQRLPFGRPYGKIRIGDLSTVDLSSLNLLLQDGTLGDPSQVVYLDTETTGLAGGTGTCAFLIGIGRVQGTQFLVEQFFLRDYPEEKAMLASLAETLGSYPAVATFNGKTFDIPLLETRYTLARLKSPFARMLHFDLLHPARQLWKLRLESCKLTVLENAILGLGRQGDVPGSEIPEIYFDYLRSGDARGLQPIFYHNALDVITLAALTLEIAQIFADSGMRTLTSGVDLFGLSRLFDRAGAREQSVAVCQRALVTGLPQSIESRALRHLASQHKRGRQYELAVELWLELSRREFPLAIEALEELAVHYEHRRRDPKTALEFTVTALEYIRESALLHPDIPRFTRRLERLQRKVARAHNPTSLPLA